MRTLQRVSWLIALSGLALPVAAQATSATGIRLFELLAEEDAAQRSASPFSHSFGANAPHMPFELAPAAMDHVANGLRTEASPVSRGSLDPASEATVPFSTAPGGIVLGLTASADAEAWKGARLRFEAPAALELVAADGRAYALPVIDRASLRTFLAFLAAGRSDTLIDIYGDDLRLAPAFAGTPLAWRLERADRAPRKTIPGVGQQKSLIVDRAVGFSIVPGTERIALFADVEIRLYTKKDSWLLRDALQRTATWPFLAEGRELRPLLPLPAGTELDALQPALVDVSRIAGWLGFLRWAQQHDSPGVSELRCALASPAAPQAGKVSASQR